MAYRYALFDLDGTLTDPAEGITNSILYALKKYGIEVADRRELYQFIGPPLQASFEAYCGFSKEEAQRAAACYREYYTDRGIFENRVYDGLEDLLKRLKASGFLLAVATSKPQVFAKQILEHFGLARYFAYIAGSELDGSRVEKGEVIRYALERCPVADLAGAVMVGDRKYDILGAKEAGIASVGVLFGYGDRAELESAGADFIAETVAEIGEILLKG